MMTWLAHHRHALIATLARMGKTPFATLFAIIAIGVALSLPAGLFVLLHNVTRLAGNLPARPEISVFMHQDAHDTDIAAMRQRLQARPDLAGFRFVPRAQALAALSEQAGMSDLTAGLNNNPLPDAWIITPAQADAQNMARIAADIRGWPQVAQVQDDSQWAQRLTALLGLGRDLVLMLAILLGAALVAVSGNTIRLQILTRREEIEVSRLIGATDRYIRRPFLYFGVVQGLFGGLTAWLIVAVSVLLLDLQASKLAALYASRFHLLGLGLTEALVLLATAAALGWLGAYLAVSRSLRLIEPR
ncbi:cell division protein FtsX [Sulfuriferula plumbiphila]|uniref:Cell division protein FtsX n=1 Tax=Sulfuriferula plumbiphila TaxID=171865 RepID=A0A512L6Z3_9PROT|nr:permease-like cell division protein FtsX [Sulfuriferula plumbiphila]BBP02878.1 cell division protein FtsX [Sulfuriferula plumbiphila]GEP30255.1 cell division protein FtsX [Sulfuriferula plumbiphila]